MCLPPFGASQRESPSKMYCVREYKYTPANTKKTTIVTTSTEHTPEPKSTPMPASKKDIKKQVQKALLKAEKEKEKNEPIERMKAMLAQQKPKEVAIAKNEPEIKKDREPQEDALAQCLFQQQRAFSYFLKQNRPQHQANEIEVPKHCKPEVKATPPPPPPPPPAAQHHYDRHHSSSRGRRRSSSSSFSNHSQRARDYFNDMYARIKKDERKKMMGKMMDAMMDDQGQRTVTQPRGRNMRDLEYAR